MAKTFYLSLDSAEITNNCFAEIRSQLSDGLNISVTIKEKSQSRSDAQRKLANVWYDQWAAFSGENRTRQRNLIMHECGRPIFYRDNIIVNGACSADTLDAIDRVKASGLVLESRLLELDFAANSASSNFKVKQMAEYLDNIWKFSVEKGVNLHVPSECDNAKFNKAIK